MPSQVIHCAPFSNIYIGDVGGGNYTQLSVSTTQEQRVTWGFQEAFSFALENSAQVGSQSITADLVFLSDDETISILAKGNLPGDSLSDPPGFSKMSLLMIHPDFESNSSILIPECYVIKNLVTNYSKTQASVIPLRFFWQQRDLGTDIFTRDTADNLLI